MKTFIFVTLLRNCLPLGNLHRAKSMWSRTLLRMFLFEGSKLTLTQNHAHLTFHLGQPKKVSEFLHSYK